MYLNVNYEQDLSGFSGDGFDVDQWINQTFKGAEAAKQSKEVI